MTDGQVPRGRIRRTMPLAGFTARAAGGRLVAGLREKAGDTGAVNRFHERTAERYTELLGHSKGVLMKAGQIFSSIDMNGADGGISPYEQALTRLQTQSPPMAPALARSVIESELGVPTSQAYASFTDDPISSASIGQVHRATLHDGRDVVVKIQYPGVAQAIQDDLANTELVTTFLRVTFALLDRRYAIDLPATARDISAQIREELNYRQEAANISTFHRLFEGHPFIRVPEAVPELSTQRVLTMTYVDGIDWAEAQQADQELKNTWAEALWRFSLAPLQHACAFYTDLHPGNYRFGLDGSLGIVDFGSVKNLRESHRLAWIRMVAASIQQRVADLYSTMKDAGFLSADSTMSPGEALRWMNEINADATLPQPVTYTPQLIDRNLTALDSPLSRRISLPPDLIYLVRFPLGVRSAMSKLGATVSSRSAAADMIGIAEPETPLGIRHVAWVRERGLPFGLDPRAPSEMGARL
ncbi:ABC1 kinase family protein [Mycobacteroides immunogenum]|uniref:ABC transporter n=1 Tax=Mycobacteroides immunogenum TaxID=83262 RepID=A0A7V8LNL4_9MYCO|nr:AarF/ABC1/UbiB kinase family protein [Mycobacteroides immunogenum]AMT71805.1 ABC transporter [Mycobacteroides immunogenum]ANO04930.1 ABC transporter [Mycobacteroides immunogenum]KIU39360.1 ABC transporter [Mycobacteroides immunogenum]KPG07184.1 ABC transporter [Mycobacteroides immunogenum]KPG07347.1 ABC transporter [Mycobacteroides immunogenum]